MSNVKKLKRQLLRTAVQENVEGIQKRRPRARRTPQPQSWLVVSLSFLALFYVIMTIIGGRREVANLSPPVDEIERTDSLTLAGYEAASPEVIFPEPQPIDLMAFPLGIKKIILDAGHGGDEPGAVMHGIIEKEVTLDIGLRLRRLLTESSFEVLMTREKDETVSLNQRAVSANSWGGDIFVSIHINWIEMREVRGIETYYLGQTDDPATLTLARLENQQSGYSLADFRQLLEGLYLDVRRDESHRLAETIQDELFDFLRPINPTLEDRGVKTAPFVVLVATEMPAVLAEVSCLSNQEEARLLASPDYRQDIAQALFQGIRSYANLLNSISGKGS